MGHGAQKLFGWLGGPGLRGEADYLAGLRFRAPVQLAVVLGAGELTAGALFAAGLLVPFAALALAVFMVNAIGAALLPRGYWVVDGGCEYAVLIWTVAIAVTATGPGRFSLDAAAGWEASLRGPWWALGAALASVVVSALTLTALRGRQTRRAGAARRGCSER